MTGPARGWVYAAISFLFVAVMTATADLGRGRAAAVLTQLALRRRPQEHSPG